MPAGGDELEDKNEEFAFVINDVTLETNKNVGIAVGESHRMLEHTCRYLIQFVMKAETGRACELKLDNMQQKIMKLLDENQDITGTVDESIVERVTVLRPTQIQGKTKQGRIITLKAVITTGE